MNKLLDDQIQEVLTRSDTRAFIECERALRVGAATLWRAAPAEVTATTVVCSVSDRHFDAVESLVGKIAEEYGFDARIQQQQGSLSVRFSWPR